MTELRDDACRESVTPGVWYLPYSIAQFLEYSSLRCQQADNSYWASMVLINDCHSRVCNLIMLRPRSGERV